MDQEIRQKLLQAKKDIESKSGVKFRPDTIALADLISEFVAIKVGGQAAPKETQPNNWVGEVGAPASNDFLYNS